MSKTTSKELSIALKEAGAKQESEYFWGSQDGSYWIRGHRSVFGLAPGVEGRDFECISSFDCHELFLGLPFEVAVVSCSDGTFYAHMVVGMGDTLRREGSTPAEALGKLYLWCLENEYVKE